MAQSIKHQDVLAQLYGLLLSPGTPENIRSDNSSEFRAENLIKWLENVGVSTLFIEQGSPGEIGYAESFIGKMRDELLNGEIIDTLLEASVIIEGW